MNKRIKAKWLLALRSGKYKQAHEHLYHGRAYCCLGVLCRATETSIVMANNNELLTGSMLKKVGLTQKQQDRLSRLNDGYRTSDGREFKPKNFEQIADWIEEHL